MFIKRKAFTLIELLAVIAIVGIMLSILLPAVYAARTAARRVTCQSNMRQTGLAILHYTDIHGQFPPSKCTYTFRLDGSTSVREIGHGLVPFLLPFMEQTVSASLYRFDVNWQNTANRTAREVRIGILLCPEAEPVRFHRYGPSDSVAYHRNIVEYFCSDYTSCDEIALSRNDLQTIGVSRSDWRAILARAAFGNRNYVRSSLPTLQDVLSALDVKPVAPSAISDGLSNSMMLFECAGRPKQYGRDKVPGSQMASPVGGARWADNESQIWLHRVCPHSTQMFNCSNQEEIFGLHPGGCNFLYGDGSLRFHVESMSPEAFVSRFTAYAGD